MSYSGVTDHRPRFTDYRQVFFCVANVGPGIAEGRRHRTIYFFHCKERWAWARSSARCVWFHRWNRQACLPVNTLPATYVQREQTNSLHKMALSCDSQRIDREFVRWSKGLHACHLLNEAGSGMIFRKSKMDSYEGMSCLVTADTRRRTESCASRFPETKKRTRVKKEQNTRMLTLRQAVEWNFKEVIKNFAFVDFRKQMKMYEKPVNTLYRVAFLLTNCHNRLYPNQTNQYFDLEPPTLFEYLSSLP
ncbi:hypothetical protein RvY_18226-2 [Ramazzottius varieornatus]|nr:hypothetical protein RvY_18226-2 [Ramazzottius varieornatus]